MTLAEFCIVMTSPDFLTCFPYIYQVKSRVNDSTGLSLQTVTPKTTRCHNGADLLSSRQEEIGRCWESAGFGAPKLVIPMKTGASEWPLGHWPGR